MRYDLRKLRKKRASVYLMPQLRAIAISQRPGFSRSLQQPALYSFRLFSPREILYGPLSPHRYDLFFEREIFSRDMYIGGCNEGKFPGVGYTLCIHITRQPSGVITPRPRFENSLSAGRERNECLLGKFGKQALGAAENPKQQILNAQ